MNQLSKTFFLIGALFLIAAGLFLFKNSQAKNPSVTKQGENKLQVSASFYPLYYFASIIGGDKVHVANLTPSGVEPHEYEPSPQQLAQIENGDLLILNGGVEAWGEKMKKNLAGTHSNVLTTGDGLLTKQITEEGEKMRDPHIWLDPQLAKKQVHKITESYIKTDPANTTYYQTNEKMLQERLELLSTKYQQGLQTCKNHDIITSHEAFAYLADRYHLHQVAIAGLSTEEEPTAQKLAEVATFAKQNGVKYIFFESLVSPKLSETIAKEIGAKTLVLDPIEGISDDNIQQGKNYFTVMEDNLQNLQTALQCTK